MSKSTNSKIAISECKYCDGTMSHRPYGMDVAVCMSCGAEWTPITVYYTHEELFGSEEEQHDADEHCLDAEVAICPECNGCYAVGTQDEDIKAIHEEGQCIDCINYDTICPISGHKQGACPCDQCSPEA
jgi:hypothetical protein